MLLGLADEGALPLAGPSSGRRRQPRSRRSRTRSKSRGSGSAVSPCCSDADLVCCDAIECASGPASPTEAAAAAESTTTTQQEEASCSECLQGIPTDECTDDCFKVPKPSSSSSSSAIVKPAVVVADCDECNEHPDQVVACDDPACTDTGIATTSAPTTADREDAILLEWDEKSVDELLKCCCNGTEHSHASFTTGSYGHTHSHVHTHAGHALEAEHLLKPTEGSPGNYLAPSPVFNYQLPLHPHPYALRQHQHSHGHAGQTASQEAASSSNSNRSDLSAPSSATYTFSSPALSSVSASTGSISLSDHSVQKANRGHGHVRHQSQPVSLSHSNGPSSSQMADFTLPMAAMSAVQQSPGSSAGHPQTFCCQWSGCTAAFGNREELVGHVNVVHLLHVKPTTAVREQQHRSTEFQASPGAQQAVEAKQHNGKNNVDTTQMNDASFEHTMRCLWDSCDVPLPPVSYANTASNGLDLATLGNTGFAVQPSPKNELHSADTVSQTNHQQQQHHLPVNGGCAGHNHTPDAYTASLVKHLLQDHLHLNPEVLMQLSPSIERSLSMTGAGTNLGVPATHAQTHVMPQSQAFDFSGPSSASIGIDQPGSLPQNTLGTLLPAGGQQEYEIVRPSPTLSNSGKIYSPSAAATFSRPQSAASAVDSFGFNSPALQAIFPDSKPDNRGMSTSAPTDATSHLCGWSGCSEAFDSTSSLMDHISNVHIGSGKSFYHCAWEGCPRAHSGRSFNQRQKIIRHLRTHVGDKPFTCPECNRSFSEATTLQQHLRTHTLEKPFPCTFPGCGKHFAIQSALTIHMRTHTGAKPFKCPVEGCGQSFAESSNLSKHVKTHQAAEENGGKGRRKRKQESVDVWDDAAPLLKALKSVA